MEAAGGQQNIPDPDASAISRTPSTSSRRTKSGRKVWGRMSLFKKKARSRENVGETSGSSAVTSPRNSGNSDDPGSSFDGAEFDFSPETSASSCSPEHCRSLIGSTSSSDSDLCGTPFQADVDGSLIKRSKQYPNSEIVEQSCLRPSIARALFIQLESWMSRKDGTGSYKNRKYIVKKSVCKKEDRLSEDAKMTRAVSMPGGMLLQSNKCHCAACCSCSSRERLEGACPAFSKLSTSTASLDTGLATLGYSSLYHPFTAQASNSSTADTISIQGHVSMASMNMTDCTKSRSLPSQCSPRTCAACDRPIPLIAQSGSCDTKLSPHRVRVDSPTEPVMNFCKCQTIVRSQIPHTPSPHHKTELSLSQAESTASHHDSSDLSHHSVCRQVTPSPCDSSRNQHHQHNNTPRVGPTEFKERADVIKQWFTEFSDDQKNLVLKQLLRDSDLPQLHLLSLEMETRLHASCPPNCNDRLSWLPQAVALSILSYLDPVSLSQASMVCQAWYEFATDDGLWRKFCAQSKWRLSRAGEQKQLLHHMKPDGKIQWKNVFAERYRLRNNWLKGRCNVRTFDGHTQGISCVQFDDTRIVSGSSDKTIKVWNIRTNIPWTVQTLVGHSGTVRCLHLDGNRLVSGSTDRSIKVWDLSTQQSWSSIACKVTMVGHTDTVRCLQVDEEKVISGSYDKTLKLWDMKTGQCKRTLRGHGAAVLCVQFDGNKIISGSCDKTIKVWSFEECVMTLEGHQDAVTCLQFDSTRIFSGSLDCNLKFWDINTGQCLNTIDWKASEGHTGVVRCLQADSWRVVSASDDRTLKVWSLETGQRLVTLRNHTDGVTCLQFNDSIIVSGSYDKTVKLWDFSCC